MIKKITLITILLLGNIAFSQEPKLLEKYLFATLKGKIDDRYDITMNIQIFDVYSLAGGMTVKLTGNYHYDKFGKNIYFTKGTINKNSMIIEADNEVFTFKLDESTLNNILELKTSSKKITINGTLEGNSKSFPCVINSVSPLGGKLSEIYKYNISGEATYDRDDNWKSTFSYDEYTLYSPSMKVSYFDTNIEKIDIEILKNIMKENLKEGISNTGVIGAHFTNDFRISYFDNKILCIEEYVDYFRGGAHGGTYYNYTIISLETGKELSNDFYEDLVDYSEEFKEFWKKEFMEYHKYNEMSEDDFKDYYLPKPKHKQAEDYSGYYFPTPFIFNNDGTVDIYNDTLPSVINTKIEMKKLKPYVKKDSIYRYLFD